MRPPSFAQLVGAAGLTLAITSPWAGAMVAVVALAAECASQAIGKADQRAAQARVDGLAGVVNANAARLEDALQRIERAENDIALRKQSASGVIGGMRFAP